MEQVFQQSDEFYLTGITNARSEISLLLHIAESLKITRGIL